MTIFGDKAVAIDASMASHPITQDLKTKTGVDAVIQHIDFLMNMRQDATLFNPGVCAGIADFVFEQWTPHTERLILNRIEQSLTFEPRARTENIELDFREQLDQLDITITLRLIETDKLFVYRSTLKRVI